MIIRSSGYYVKALLHKLGAKSCGIELYLVLIGFELRLKCLSEAYSLGSYDMLQRASLCSREYTLIEIEFIRCLLICKDKTAPRAS